MFYARKAALRLDQQRISLDRQYKALLVQLSKTPMHTQSAELSRRIEILRLQLNQSMNDSMTFASVMNQHMDKLNFGSMAELSIAQGRIAKIQRDLVKALAAFDANAVRQGAKR